MSEFKNAMSEMLATMIEKYPKTFFPKDSPLTEPLAIGIHWRILEDNPGLSYRKVNAFMRWYTGKMRYLRALSHRPFRLDLQGNPRGPVIESHRDFAVLTLGEREQKNAERSAA